MRRTRAEDAGNRHDVHSCLLPAPSELPAPFSWPAGHQRPLLVLLGLAHKLHGQRESRAAVCMPVECVRPGPPGTATAVDTATDTAATATATTGERPPCALCAVPPVMPFVTGVPALRLDAPPVSPGTATDTVTAGELQR